MKGFKIVFEASDRIVFKDFEIPALKEDEVLLENEYTILERC